MAEKPIPLFDLLTRKENFFVAILVGVGAYYIFPKKMVGKSLAVASIAYFANAFGPYVFEQPGNGAKEVI